MVCIFKVTWMTFSYNLQTPGGEGLWAAEKPSAVGQPGLCLSKDDCMLVVGGSAPPWGLHAGRGAQAPVREEGRFLLAP